MQGNILVIGNSGVGKSTLINAVLGEEKTQTGWGTEGTTGRLEIYGNENVPFRIIDSIGFEPTFFKKRMAINAVKKWSKESTKNGEDTQINAIWFCVDGQAAKLFDDTLKCFSSATSMWESVPLIVVITKSFSKPYREKNIEMVHNAFAKQTKYSKNLKKVIPVVASVYEINDTTFVEPDGITELIDATVELLPEGIVAAKKDIESFKLKRKRVFAQSLVAASTASAAVVGAVPIPIADSAILASLEAGEINALARIYGINNEEESKVFLNSVVEVGAVSLAAKTTISALKAIPGIGVAVSVLNSVVAASIVASIGEVCIYAFEQVYLGNKSVKDIDWITKLIESKIGSELLEKTKEVLQKLGDREDDESVMKAIASVFFKKG